MKKNVRERKGRRPHAHAHHKSKKKKKKRAAVDIGRKVVILFFLTSSHPSSQRFLLT
jgi:hypothetical protein